MLLLMATWMRWVRSNLIPIAWRLDPAACCPKPMRESADFAVVEFQDIRASGPLEDEGVAGQSLAGI